MRSSLFGRLLSATAIVAATLASVPAHAGPFTNMFVFGDSLSDTGNLKILSPSDYPGPDAGPYYDGRFSDGPVWIDSLAASLGLPGGAVPNFAGSGGTNYAIAGARTGLDTAPPGVFLQVAGIWHGVGDPNALYVLVGGGNDMRDARSAFTGHSFADAVGRAVAAKKAMAYLSASLNYLADHGAKHVLVSSLPNLGNTPEASLLDLKFASTDASNRFNALLPGLLATGEGLGLDMSFLDMAGLMQDIITDATTNGGATYGISNVSSACAGFTDGDPNNACATSLFSDTLHPSAAAHLLIGAAAFAAVVPVPEPETWALMAAGLALMAWQARRRTRRITFVA